MSTTEPTELVADAKPSRRLGQKYRFDDPDMDLFFMAALGWGSAGGLEVGQAFYVASQIKDGDADSWVRAFREYGDELNALADTWKQRGWTQSAGEMRLKAFASYRSAWQFAEPGEQFRSIFAMQQRAFAMAMEESRFPAVKFQAAYQGKSLPGVFLENPSATAPVVLVIGGADTSHEDLFLTIGRRLYEHGYSVALADLPGQGITQADGLYWEVEAEKPIAAITDVLVERFQAEPGRMALVGLSLGGYFAARAAGHDSRFATVIASTPFPDPAQLFSLSVSAALKNPQQSTSATRRAQQITFWKAGAKNVQEFLSRTAPMTADPTRVTVPFLSILGAGDSPMFASQARKWHSEIRSARKDFVLLDAASGADGHVQVNNRLRLVQETCGWLDEIFRS
jgi:pimeloyl-ACP methyl ester carboxylesterase